jgi:dephospho-CoA kinase
MILIGLTGTLGAGKGTITDYLVINHDFKHVSVSEFLAEQAIQQGLKPTRLVRNQIANKYRSFGPLGLMNAVFASIGAHTNRVVLEPQHTASEVDFIKQKGGVVLAVDADIRVRYERIQKRGSPKDDVTYEQFAEIQNLEMTSADPNKNNLGLAIARADYYLSNNVTPEELYAKVEKILEEII